MNPVYVAFMWLYESQIKLLQAGRDVNTLEYWWFVNFDCNDFDLALLHVIICFKVPEHTCWGVPVLLIFSQCAVSIRGHSTAFGIYILDSKGALSDSQNLQTRDSEIVEKLCNFTLTVGWNCQCWELTIYANGMSSRAIVWKPIRIVRQVIGKWNKYAQNFLRKSWKGEDIC